MSTNQTKRELAAMSLDAYNYAVDNNDIKAAAIAVQIGKLAVNFSDQPKVERKGKP